MKICALARDAGTGRARCGAANATLSGIGFVHVEANDGWEFLCRLSTAAPWTQTDCIAVDPLVWRGPESCREPRECVESNRLTAKASLVHLSATQPRARELVLEAPRDVPVWRAAVTPAERWWAVRIVHELLMDALVAPNWRVNAGPVLGQLRVASLTGDSWAIVDAATEVRVVFEPRPVRHYRVGGMEDVLDTLHATVLRSRKGALLKGMAGCGKTLAVHAVCASHSVPLFVVHCSADTSTADIAEAFSDAAHELDAPFARAAVLVDRVDELRHDLVAALLHEMDAARSGGNVAVFATALDGDEVDSTLRRPGRFDVELTVHAPRSAQRAAVVRALLEGGPDEAGVPADIGDLTVGMTGADLAALCRNAREMGWTAALLQTTRASAIEELPKKSWGDIGGLDSVKRRIRQAIEWPIVNALRMASMGITAARGVLLHGPPGCAKTSLVRALATNLSASFFVLTAASVYSPWVGAAEKTVRDTFERARSFSPAIVFIDEIEAVVGKRSAGGDDSGSGKVQERVLSTLLNEMDGIEDSRSVVVVVGATNRLDRIDEALLRPGRFDYIQEVPLPDLETRAAILSVYAALMPVEGGASAELVGHLAQATDGCSGAQLEALCTEAALFALRDAIAEQRDLSTVVVGRTHFTRALGQIIS